MAGMGRVQIIKAMNEILEDGIGIDHTNNEVSCTQLAEAAADAFGLDDTPERFFEIAFEFDNSGPLHPVVRNIINSRDSSWF